MAEVVGITLKQFADGIAAVKKYSDDHDVQSDFNVTDTASLAYIKNKPEAVTTEDTPIDFDKEWKS